MTITSGPQRRTVFMDCETISLRHDRRAWEVAAIIREPGGARADDTERTWFVDVDDLDLGELADLKSLEIGGFYARHPQVRAGLAAAFAPSEASVMDEVERVTRGAWIVGAVPNFDTETLAARMRYRGRLPAWHYHIIDVETLAAGHGGFRPPWGFDDILAAYGLVYNEVDRHTALGDARMARDLFDAVYA